MNSETSPAANNRDVEAAQLLISKMGLSPQDLLNTTCDTPRSLNVPTFAEYIPRVRGSVPAGTRRAYDTYWKRTLELWGHKRLNEPTALELKQLAEKIKACASHRRNSRGGRVASEHLIAALRCIYNNAVADGWINEAENPAHRTPKPRRLPSTRRGLSDSQLREINKVAATTGNDPSLDSILLRLHTETACRRGGALGLRPGDLDTEQCLIRLCEKGGTVRWQPVSPTLMAHLRAHIEYRNASHPNVRLLRYYSGRPITSRRYDHLWARIGRNLPWVDTQQVSTHWLRHTTLTWVERNFGYAIAHAYAGHSVGNHDTVSTTTYIRSNLQEVASALAALTSEPHPLASA